MKNNYSEYITLVTNSTQSRGLTQLEDVVVRGLTRHKNPKEFLIENHYDIITCLDSDLISDRQIYSTESQRLIYLLENSLNNLEDIKKLNENRISQIYSHILELLVDLAKTDSLIGNVEFDKYHPSLADTWDYLYWNINLKGRVNEISDYLVIAKRSLPNLSNPVLVECLAKHGPILLNKFEGVDLTKLKETIIDMNSEDLLAINHEALTGYPSHRNTSQVLNIQDTWVIPIVVLESKNDIDLTIKNKTIRLKPGYHLFDGSLRTSSVLSRPNNPNTRHKVIVLSY